MGRFLNKLLGLNPIEQAEKDAAQDAAAEAQATTIAGLITQGAAAPSTKPTAKNLLYFATTAQKLYVSTGTSASSDWKEVKAVDPA